MSDEREEVIMKCPSCGSNMFGRSFNSDAYQCDSCNLIVSGRDLRMFGALSSKEAAKKLKQIIAQSVEIHEKLKHEPHQ